MKRNCLDDLKRETNFSYGIFSLSAAEVEVRNPVLALRGSSYGSASVIALSFSAVLRRKSSKLSE